MMFLSGLPPEEIEDDEENEDEDEDLVVASTLY